MSHANICPPDFVREFEFYENCGNEIMRTLVFII